MARVQNRFTSLKKAVAARNKRRYLAHHIVRVTEMSGDKYYFVGRQHQIEQLKLMPKVAKIESLNGRKKRK